MPFGGEMMTFNLDLHAGRAGLALHPDKVLKPLKSLAESVDKSITGKNSPTAENPEAKEQAKIKQACQDFEAVFLNFMLKQMRETVPQSDLTGHDPGKPLYQGMMDEELSRQMAAGGGMGLADMLYRQFTEHGPKIAESNLSGKDQKPDGIG
jgi:flagellar protein FlgJ